MQNFHALEVRYLKCGLSEWNVAATETESHQYLSIKDLPFLALEMLTGFCLAVYC